MHGTACEVVTGKLPRFEKDKFRALPYRNQSEEKLQAEYFDKTFSLKFSPLKDFNIVKLPVVHDKMSGCCAGTSLTVTVLNQARTDWNDACTVESKQTESLLVHSKYYYTEFSSRPNIQAEFFASERVTYSKPPNCYIYNLLLVCTEELDWKTCYDYSLRYCPVARMYSRLYVSSSLFGRTSCYAPYSNRLVCELRSYVVLQVVDLVC